MLSCMSCQELIAGWAIGIIHSVFKLLQRVSILCLLTIKTATLSLPGFVVSLCRVIVTDCFFVPSWNWYQFRNKSGKEPAIIFSVTDRPVLETLGLFREERE